MLVQIQKSYKFLQWFFWWTCPFSSCDPKIYCILRMSLWIELSWFFACWQWWNNDWFDQHPTLYQWLLYAVLVQLSLSYHILKVIIKSGWLIQWFRPRQIQTYFIGHLPVAERVLYIRVCSSYNLSVLRSLNSLFCPSIHPEVFFEFTH